MRTTENPLYIVPTRRIRVVLPVPFERPLVLLQIAVPRWRYLVHRPSTCWRLGHQWSPVDGLYAPLRVLETGAVLRQRRCSQCDRCGLLRWAW